MSATSGRLLLLLALLVLTGCAKPLESSPTAEAVVALPTGNVVFVRSYDEAMQQAAASGRPVLLLFAAPWCVYCQSMADDALSNPEVVALAQQFVPIFINPDDSAELAARYRVRSYPTIQFLTPGGVPLHRLTGMQSSETLLANLRAALHATARHAADRQRAL